MKRQAMDLGGILAGESPFSFVYGGIDSATLLPAWSHDGKNEAGRSDRALKVALDVVLRELEPDAEYEVALVDSARSRPLTGAELTHLKVDIRSAPGSLLVLYRKVK